MHSSSDIKHFPVDFLSNFFFTSFQSVRFPPNGFPLQLSSSGFSWRPSCPCNSYRCSRLAFFFPSSHSVRLGTTFTRPKSRQSCAAVRWRQDEQKSRTITQRTVGNAASRPFISCGRWRNKEAPGRFRLAAIPSTSHVDLFIVSLRRVGPRRCCRSFIFARSGRSASRRLRHKAATVDVRHRKKGSRRIGSYRVRLAVYPLRLA